MKPLKTISERLSGTILPLKCNHLLTGDKIPRTRLCNFNHNTFNSSKWFKLRYLLFHATLILNRLNLLNFKLEMSDQKKTKILFVCLGNICRSPMAACVFKHLARSRGVENKYVVHSAGIGGWYAGSPGDNRMLMTLKKHKVEAEHRARQVRDSDFNEFDYIFGMDEDNIKSLKKMAPKDCKAKIELFGDYDPEGVKVIRDPYYDTDLKGFEAVYEQCTRCSNALLDQNC